MAARVTGKASTRSSTSKISAARTVSATPARQRSSNRLYGVGGNDILEGRGGSDILDGGMGSDTATYSSAASGVSVNLGNALPQNTLGAGIDSFISIDNLTGSALPTFFWAISRTTPCRASPATTGCSAAPATTR